MVKASGIFSKKTVLVTGGTGSFGRTFAKKLLQEDAIAKLIIFSRDELKQWEMRMQDPIFASSKARFFLGDVRDSERLRRAFMDVDIIIHAAALKQVPAAEYNPTECIKTNVLGAMNIINAAIDCGVQKVVALSSDKAVNPVNLYGATKLCSDKLFIAASSYVGKRGFPLFSVVRYGNVLGSRGSLLPHWKNLLAAGEKSLPVTDKRMTRFWITLKEAAEFVSFATNKMQGCEIFIPKSPSVNIIDLAKALSPKIQLSFTGIRPGEKLHEVLISSDEARNCYDCNGCYLILPSEHLAPKKHSLIAKAKRVAEDFVLASNSNPLFISSLHEIKNLIDCLNQ